MTANQLPTWMRQIIDTPSILNEYMQYMEGKAAEAMREGVKASKAGNSYLANTHFGRAEAYESLKNTIQINLRESEAQDAFQKTSGTSKRGKR